MHSREARRAIARYKASGRRLEARIGQALFQSLFVGELPSVPNKSARELRFLAHLAVLHVQDREKAQSLLFTHECARHKHARERVAAWTDRLRKAAEESETKNQPNAEHGTSEKAQKEKESESPDTNAQIPDKLEQEPQNKDTEERDEKEEDMQSVLDALIRDFSADEERLQQRWKTAQRELANDCLSTERLSSDQLDKRFFSITTEAEKNWTSLHCMLLRPVPVLLVTTEPKTASPTECYLFHSAFALSTRVFFHIWSEQIAPTREARLWSAALASCKPPITQPEDVAAYAMFLFAVPSLLPLLQRRYPQETSAFLVHPYNKELDELVVKVKFACTLAAGMLLLYQTIAGRPFTAADFPPDTNQYQFHMRISKSLETYSPSALLAMLPPKLAKVSDISIVSRKYKMQVQHVATLASLRDNIPGFLPFTVQTWMLNARFHGTHLPADLLPTSVSWQKVVTYMNQLPELIAWRKKAVEQFFLAYCDLVPSVGHTAARSMLLMTAGCSGSKLAAPCFSDSSRVSTHDQDVREHESKEKKEEQDKNTCCKSHRKRILPSSWAKTLPVTDTRTEAGFRRYLTTLVRTPVRGAFANWATLMAEHDANANRIAQANGNGMEPQGK
jgi:hypothetical protein